MRSRAILLAVALATAVVDGNAALSPNAQRYLDEGLRHLYNLDYAESRASFRKIVELEPDNPFGYLFESGGIWWQSSMEYGLFNDTPTLQGLFEQDVEAAIRKADPLTDSKDSSARADGYFVTGIALGTRGQWELLRGHWVKAYFNGKKALKYVKKCLKYDDTYYDAYLGLGVFDYQAAHLGGALKLGAIMGGVRGDEQRGLAELTTAMERGRFAWPQAAQFLSTMYFSDQRDFVKALETVLRLRQTFPESVYFKFFEALTRWRLGDWPGSLKVARTVLDYAKQNPRAFNRKLLSLACGLSGQRCLDSADVQAALPWFDKAIASSAKKPAETERVWLALNHLYRGYAHDVIGRTDQAERDYRWVLAHPDFSDCHARARECLEESCDAASLLRYFRALSRGEPWPTASAKP